jgi:hypothetical protein
MALPQKIVPKPTKLSDRIKPENKLPTQRILKENPIVLGNSCIDSI